MAYRSLTHCVAPKASTTVLLPLGKRSNVRPNRPCNKGELSMYSHTLETYITGNHRITIDLPASFPEGDAEIIILSSRDRPHKSQTRPSLIFSTGSKSKCPLVATKHKSTLKLAKSVRLGEKHSAGLPRYLRADLFDRRASFSRSASRKRYPSSAHTLLCTF